MHTPDELHTQIQYRLVEKLADSERKYRQLLENLTEVVFEVNQQGHLTFLNPAWTRTLGYAVDESIGHSLTHYGLVDDQDLGQSLLKELLENRSCIQSELRFVHQDGAPIWMGILAQPNAQGGASGTLTDITQRKQAILKLQYNAEHDGLTGLMNRAGFVRALEQANLNLQNNPRESFAVFFLDLDRFKDINDSFGHLVGDQLLVRVTQRLKECLRSTDCIARFGGDEFNILLCPTKPKSEVIEVAKRINQALSRPFYLENQELFTSTSIGIVMNTAGKGYQPQQILQNADTALYQAKINGRSQFAMFDQKMHDQVLQRLTLEHDLRYAIKQGDLDLFYQPILDLKLDRIIGFEALLRWEHPQFGWIAPPHIISIAEESGLIITLSWKILEMACIQRQLWTEKKQLDLNLFIGINFSSHQFLQPNLISQVQAILNRYDISPHQIKLEITETTLMSDVSLVSQNLAALDHEGFKISIDDFGTGYSSLNYLNQFPLSTLKIDQSFICHGQDTGIISEIVKTIIVLAHNLGMDVIAEGVETVSQLKELQGLGCDMAQGFLWAKPMPGHAIATLVPNSASQHCA